MDTQPKSQLIKYLPLALVVTFLVAVLPVGGVWWLRTEKIITSPWLALFAGAGISFALSCGGGALWKKRTDAQDILFGELMIWGWVQRYRHERRLIEATDLLGLGDGSPEAVFGGRLSDEQRIELLKQLASSLEARDPYTHGHSRRVARHSWNIAKRMNLSDEEVAKIRLAAAVHDVGKVKTPTEVLHKPGKLSDEEFKIIQRHPVEGAILVRALGDDELTAMVRHHHERLDGTGYPHRIAGEDIPLGARIISVADTFDAITSTRPYRSGRAHKAAIDILHAEAGSQLDPDAVRAFCSCYAGRRPLALWMVAINIPQRVAAWFGGGVTAANAASVANVVATAATTAAVGTVAVNAAVHEHSSSHDDGAPRLTAAAAVTAPASPRPRTASSTRPVATGPRRRTVAPRRDSSPSVPRRSPAVLRVPIGAAPAPPAPSVAAPRPVRQTIPLSRPVAPPPPSTGAPRPVPAPSPGHKTPPAESQTPDPPVDSSGPAPTPATTTPPPTSGSGPGTNVNTPPGTGTGTGTGTTTGTGTGTSTGTGHGNGQGNNGNGQGNGGSTTGGTPGNGQGNNGKGTGNGGSVVTVTSGTGGGTSTGTGTGVHGKH